MLNLPLSQNESPFPIPITSTTAHKLKTCKPKSKKARLASFGFLNCSIFASQLISGFLIWEPGGWFRDPGSQFRDPCSVHWPKLPLSQNLSQIPEVRLKGGPTVLIYFPTKRPHNKMMMLACYLVLSTFSTQAVCQLPLLCKNPCLKCYFLDLYAFSSLLSTLPLADCKFPAPFGQSWWPLVIGRCRTYPEWPVSDCLSSLSTVRKSASKPLKKKQG